MADSNITLYENSREDGEPIECYRFNIGITTYLFTSARDEVTLTIKENGLTRTETYSPDYIKRTTIKPGSQGSAPTTDIEMSGDNVIAMLYSGPPPEEKVNIQVLRLHDQDHTAFDIVFTGRGSQCAFGDSIATLTCKMESYMDQEIPNGRRQFTCGNVIYDGKCRLKEADWQVEAFVDRAEGLHVYSSTFANYPDGYFSNGIFRYNGNVRQVLSHVGNYIILKYPFTELPREKVLIAPGCDLLFSTCAKKFNNYLNCSACLYVPPANPEKTAVGRGTYWQDEQVIQRDSDGFVGTISL